MRGRDKDSGRAELTPPALIAVRLDVEPQIENALALHLELSATLSNPSKQLLDLPLPGLAVVEVDVESRFDARADLHEATAWFPHAAQPLRGLRQNSSIFGSVGYIRSITS